MANNFSVVMLNILAGALAVLREEAYLARVVAHDFDGAAAKKGSTVSVSVPVAQAVYDVTPAAVPPALVDITIPEVTFTLDQWKATRFHMTEKQIQEMADGNQVFPGQIGEAVRVIANTLNTYLWSKYKRVYGYAGTAGTTPFATTIDGAVDLKQVLVRQRTPSGNLKMVVNPTAETLLLKLATLQKFLEHGTDATLLEAEIGRLMAFDVFRDRDIPLHTAGTITTGLIAKAATAVAAGLKTFIATTAASTGAIALKEGDILAIAGHVTTYVLTADATEAGAAADEALFIEPGLEIALVGSEAITVKASHRVNLGFDPSAFGLAMRTLPDSIEGQPTLGVSEVMTDPVTGIPLKLTFFPGYHAMQFELSVLYGGGIIDARRIARLAGEGT
jgi:hypothetical protein